MCYLKITAADGTVTLVNEGSAVVLGLTAKTTTNSVVKNGRITSVIYNGTTISSVAQYDGTNILYEYGLMTDFGDLRVIFSNR